MATGAPTNETLQAEELEAMSAIFGEDWVLENAAENSFSLNITNTRGNTLYFKVIIPEDYPLQSPPSYIISAPWMDRTSKTHLSSLLENIYSENLGESILYLWITKIQDFIETPMQVQNEESVDEPHISIDISSTEKITCNEVPCKNEYEIPVIHHGQPITDRKSVFQAHLAKVVSVEQVNQVLQALKENKKILAATHNIYAYRIDRGNKTFISDCEDDGEHRAGSTLLHLLQIVDAINVIVVVSRWYGGIHLGPDRFKHINNAARTLLSELGYISEKSKDSGSEKQRKPLKTTHKF